MTKVWKRYVVGSWKTIDAAARDEFGELRIDWRVAIVLITVAMSLTLQEYVGSRAMFAELFPKPPRVDLDGNGVFEYADRWWVLKSYAWWIGGQGIGYVVLPMLVVFAMPGERLRDYFVRFGGFFRHLPIYLVLLGLIMPVIFLASRSSSFTDTYPLYKLANRSIMDLLLWEALYLSQFVMLEFFFRGFMLRGCRSLGANAIFIMILPYCMIHFGKPMVETLGAIGAGIILGTLAMRTRSIWGGVVVHVGVALTMDLLALYGPGGGG